MIDFTKMHGIGNDYLLTEAEHPDFGALARRLCDRRRSIGADGIIAIRREPHLEMRVFNSDGTAAGMCGNGMRCVAFLAAERLGFDARMRIRCAERLCDARVLERHGPVAMVELDLGAARTHVEAIRVDPNLATITGHHVVLADTGIEGWLTDVGNPHLVLFESGLDWREWGARLSTHGAFPDGINVMFVSRRSDGGFDLVPWERGAGPTSACGSGAVASAIALADAGCSTPGTQTFHLPGGVLHVDVKERAILRGEAAFAFDVSIDVA
ncbi:MAG: diaminopimelate epimerase [Phycisphaerales bacterium]|nr:diaminopimelate epimerase [Phycisphaerales bacterium]